MVDSDLCKTLPSAQNSSFLSDTFSSMTYTNTTCTQMLPFSLHTSLLLVFNFMFSLIFGVIFFMVCTQIKLAIKPLATEADFKTHD